MRALTVRQPWASAIATGAKQVENRTLRTRHRGPLAIHAGLGWSDRGATDPRIADWHGARMFGRKQDGTPWTPVHPMRHPELFPRGVILATCELTDCHPAQGDCCTPWGEQTYEQADGQPRRDIWHWLLEDIQPLNPTQPATGRLGLWTVDLDSAPPNDPDRLARTVPHTAAQ